MSRPGDLILLLSPAASEFQAAAAAPAAGVTAAPGQHGTAPRGTDLRERWLDQVEPGGLAALLTGASPQVGQAALVIVTACPTPGCFPPARDGVATLGHDSGDERLYAACQRALAPSGLLVIITLAARHLASPGGLVARARGAGLTYTQHIIAMHADIVGSHLTAATTPRRDPDPGTSAGPDPGRHLAVHTDLLVFTQGSCRP